MIINWQQTGIYTVIAALISAFVTISVSSLTTFLNHRFQVDRETQKWRKEELANSYKRAVFCLIKINKLYRGILSDGTTIVPPESQLEVIDLYADLESQIYWILATEPAKKKSKLQVLKQELEILTSDPYIPRLEQIKKIEELIIILMAKI